MQLIKGVSSYTIKDSQGNNLASGNQPITQPLQGYNGMTLHQRLTNTLQAMQELGYTLVSVKRERLLLGLTRIALTVEKSL